MKTGDLVVKQIEYIKAKKRQYLREWREDRRNGQKANKESTASKKRTNT
jgi:hypothetical protein